MYMFMLRDIYKTTVRLTKMALSNVNDYFSITDLLVTEERVPSEIQLMLPNLGFLNVATKDDDLYPGTKLDLPLWLASQLRSKRNLIVTCEVPKIYRENYKEILHADACAVDLPKWNQHYYELGLSLPETPQSNGLKIPQFLLEVFKIRFRMLMDLEQNAFISQTQRAQLTVLERKLLSQGSKQKVQLLNWLNKGTKTIQASNVANNIKKRKSFDV